MRFGNKKSVKARIYLTLRRDKRAYAQCYRDMAQANPSAASYILLGEAYMHIQMPEVMYNKTGLFHVAFLDSKGETAMMCVVRGRIALFLLRVETLRDVQRPVYFRGSCRSHFITLNDESPLQSHNSTLAELFLFGVLPSNLVTHVITAFHDRNARHQAAIESFEIALDTDPSDSVLAGQVGRRKTCASHLYDLPFAASRRKSQLLIDPWMIYRFISHLLAPMYCT